MGGTDRLRTPARGQQVAFEIVGREEPPKPFSGLNFADGAAFEIASFWGVRPQKLATSFSGLSMPVIPSVASEATMRPNERRDSGQTDILRSRLDAIIDIGHPLVKLAQTIDWWFLEQRFGAVYEGLLSAICGFRRSRPGIPRRCRPPFRFDLARGRGVLAEVVAGAGIERGEDQSSRMSRSTRPSARSRCGWRPSSRASARSSNRRWARW